MGFFKKLGIVCATPVAAAFTFYQFKPPKIKDATDLPLIYNPEQIKTFWKKHPRHILYRLLEVNGQLFPFFIRFLVARKTSSDWDDVRSKEYAKELKQLLISLGPTYIKFGQVLSMRPDVVPVCVLEELQKLCDQVPCYPTKEAIALIETELKKPIEELFEGIETNTEPEAGASLGQVYKCTIKNTDQVVAVKVQRPDIIQSVSLDLFIIRTIYGLYDTCFTQIFTNQQAYHIPLIDGFAEASYKELDYINEGENQERFQKALSCLKNIQVPDVFWSHTSRKVLTTEWIDGAKLADSSPEVIQKLVPFGVECFLYQLLNMSFFHSDPHPGNLLVRDGKLVLIDFGLCADIPSQATDHLTETLLHLMCGDLEGLLQDLVNLTFLKQDALKLKDLKPIMGSILHSGFFGEESGSSTAARKKRLSGISNELNDVFFKFPFNVPEYFALITRALITLEGIALKGDENFDIFQASYPYAVSHALDIFGYDSVMSIVGQTIKSGGLYDLRSEVVERLNNSVQAI